MAMRFEHEFTVPVPIEQAWAVLLDVERVAPCLPGAALDIFEGDEFTGRMKVKVGPITVTYRGTAKFQDVDKDSYTLTIQASGKEARGSGTASATVKARLQERDEATLVTVETSFNVTGRPAQFGRGVMAEVGGKLIERFADNLAALISEPTVEPVPQNQGQDQSQSQEEERHLSAVPPAPEQEVRPPAPLRTSRTPDEEALDLLRIAGQPLLKRLAPVAGALVALLALVWIIRRLMR
ncbi:carbon monoxide dehydrogenase subunit G [Nonomuraea fuscirosea]|uniref:Carbon monoxide dehydrogenase subunit G n=1 Tax=Nonomuraea fuscirosea TaxID=1291556 RepID=A0A2T0N6H3_9ACTN|nr:SRPBCC family protein [Nonomuraea fuscirosea]PRX68138.1 carbon monoxide dehydrogenase subunit G [Nonomuraea fuscirosea]